MSRAERVGNRLEHKRMIDCRSCASSLKGETWYRDGHLSDVQMDSLTHELPLVLDAVFSPLETSIFVNTALFLR